MGILWLSYGEPRFRSRFLSLTRSYRPYWRGHEGYSRIASGIIDEIQIGKGKNVGDLRKNREKLHFCAKRFGNSKKNDYICSRFVYIQARSREFYGVRNTRN